VVVPAILGVVFLLFAIRTHRRIPQRIGEAKQRGDQRKVRGLATLQGAEDDRARLLAACDERISEADRLDEFLRSITLPELRHGVPDQRTGRMHCRPTRAHRPSRRVNLAARGYRSSWPSGPWSLAIPIKVNGQFLAQPRVQLEAQEAPFRGDRQAGPSCGQASRPLAERQQDRPQ
jgi:hypothetical protein